MTTVTLEEIEARHNELAELIAKFKADAAAPAGPIVLRIPEAMIELQPGERYAGVVLDEDGTASYHLVLLPQHPEERMTWPDAMTWASSIGGTLPTRQEQSLLFANLKSQFEGTWYWSSEKHANDGASAWIQGFNDGYQNSLLTSYEGRVRAVRRSWPVRLPGAGVARLPPHQAQHRQRLLAKHYTAGFDLASKRSGDGCAEGAGMNAAIETSEGDARDLTAAEVAGIADGLRAINVQQSPIAHATHTNEAPAGYALVPLRMTRAMQYAVEQEGWGWEDLLAAAEAITEEQYDEVANASPRQAAQGGERERFEEWAKAHGRIFLGRSGAGYEFPFTQEAWVGWQARAAQPGREALTDEQVRDGLRLHRLDLVNPSRLADGFWAGVRWAERAHGIGTTEPAPPAVLRSQNLIEKE